MSDLVQLSFDYSVLTPEQAQRTQEAEYRIVGRTQKTIVENGRDLLAVKQDIGHGYFIDWIRSLKISEDTAENWINISQRFGQIPIGSEFAERALAVLSTSKVPESARQEAKERAESGEKITEELARQIRDAHKAREQAEKKAEEAKKQLWQTQEISQKRSEQLNAQMDKLRLEIELLKKSAVISPEAQDQIDKLTKQRDNLSKLVKELSTDLDTLREDKEAKRAQEVRDSRIRQNWRNVTDTFHKQVLKLLSQFPAPVDTQVFESEDWERLSQVQELARRFQAECSNLNRQSISSFVEAG